MYNIVYVCHHLVKMEESVLMSKKKKKGFPRRCKLYINFKILNTKCSLWHSSKSVFDSFKLNFIVLR